MRISKKISYLIILVVLMLLVIIGASFLSKKRQISIKLETASQDEKSSEENNASDQQPGGQEIIDPMSKNSKEDLSGLEKIQSSQQNNGEMPAQGSDESTIQEPPRISSDSPVIIEAQKIADLQTYKNKEFSFQLEYPKNWLLEEKRNIKALSILLNSQDRKRQINDFINGKTMGPIPTSDVLVNVYKNTEKTLETFILKQAFSSEVRKISVAGASAFGGTISNDNDTTYVIFRESKGTIYEFVFGNGVTSLDNISTEGREILTSLKF